MTGAKASSKMRIEDCESSSEYASSGGVQRILQGLRTPPAQGTAIRYFQVAIGVQREHRNSISRPHSQALQGRSKAPNAIAELPKCASPVSEDDCRTIRLQLQRASQSLGETHATGSLFMDR